MKKLFSTPSILFLALLLLTSSCRKQSREDMPYPSEDQNANGSADVHFTIGQGFYVDSYTTFDLPDNYASIYNFNMDVFVVESVSGTGTIMGNFVYVDSHGEPMLDQLGHPVTEDFQYKEIRCRPEILDGKWVYGTKTSAWKGINGAWQSGMLYGPVFAFVERNSQCVAFAVAAKLKKPKSN